MSDSPAASSPLPDVADDALDGIFRLPEGANRSLGDLISPDDWRLYRLMRDLPNDDRHRVIEFAELLFNLRQALLMRRAADGGRRK